MATNAKPQDKKANLPDSPITHLWIVASKASHDAWSDVRRACEVDDGYSPKLVRRLCATTKFGGKAAAAIAAAREEILRREDGGKGCAIALVRGGGDGVEKLLADHAVHAALKNTAEVLPTLSGIGHARNEFKASPLAPGHECAVPWAVVSFIRDHNRKWAEGQARILAKRKKAIAGARVQQVLNGKNEEIRELEVQLSQMEAENKAQQGRLKETRQQMWRARLLLAFTMLVGLGVGGFVAWRKHHASRPTLPPSPQAPTAPTTSIPEVAATACGAGTAPRPVWRWRQWECRSMLRITRHVDT